MEKFNRLLALMLIFSAHFAIAQTGAVKGTITDDKGAPLQAVNISLKGTSKGASSDIDGNFRIEDVSPGKYTLNVSAVGFSAQSSKVTVVANEITVVPGITMISKTEVLDGVVVNGKRNNYVEEVSSGSLRQLTPIKELPQNIQVVSSELLRDQQVTSIMEGVIRNVSGVTMLEHCGHVARIHMRGFRIPAFRNGFNVSDSWGPLAEDMSLVDRIEFVKGPSSFMLTAGEPGGFYNVVTKKPTAAPIAQATVMAGSFDFYRASVDIGGKLTYDNKLLYRFTSFYQTADTHRGDEDVQRWAIAPSLTYNFSDRTSINAEWNYQQAESLIGAGYVFAPGDQDFGSLPRDFKFRDTNYPVTDITESTVYVNLNHQFSDNWSATVQLGQLT